MVSWRFGGFEYSWNVLDLVGLAPSHAQKGDVIVIFLGAKFPYVLRETDHGTYTFVGEAYVHGVMYGEFIKKEVEVVPSTME